MIMKNVSCEIVALEPGKVRSCYTYNFIDAAEYAHYEGLPDDGKKEYIIDNGSIDIYDFDINDYDYVKDPVEDEITNTNLPDIAIIDRYIKVLGVIEPKQAADPGTDDGHLVWMLKQIPSFTDSLKAHRWLGFVQGILIASGRLSVNEEREFTRPYFSNK